MQPPSKKLRDQARVAFRRNKDCHAAKGILFWSSAQFNHEMVSRWA